MSSDDVQAAPAIQQRALQSENQAGSHTVQMAVPGVEPLCARDLATTTLRTGREPEGGRLYPDPPTRAAAPAGERRLTSQI